MFRMRGRGRSSSPFGSFPSGLRQIFWLELTRIADRLQWGQSPSEARPEYYDQQAVEAEPPLANIPLVRIDTTNAFPRQQQQVLEGLRRVCRGDDF